MILYTGAISLEQALMILKKTPNTKDMQKRVKQVMKDTPNKQAQIFFDTSTGKISCGIGRTVA